MGRMPGKRSNLFLGFLALILLLLTTLREFFRINTSFSDGTERCDFQNNDPLFFQSIASPGEIVPVSCEAVISKRTPVLETDPNKNMHYARYTETDPPFFISLHKEKFDPTRWSIWDAGYYYEKKLAAAVVDVLRNTKGPTRVLDVGGNIGYFSLLAAASKTDIIVDTFEPNAKNRLRYCESKGLNYWHRGEFDPSFRALTGPTMNLYEYGISDIDGRLTFMEDKHNPGQGTLMEFEYNAFASKLVLESGKSINHEVPDSYSIRVITLDNLARNRGWFKNPVDIAILKIDVEGLEYKAIEGAKELLKAKMVRHIFTEISARTKREALQNIPFLDYIRSVGYRLYQVGGYRGPSNNVTWAQDETLTQQVLDAVKRARSHQLNLWWTIDPRYMATAR